MGTDSLASGFWVAFRIEPPGPLWLVHKGVGPCMGAQRKRSAVVARGQPTAPFCALPNGSLNKAGLTCHRSPTAGVGRPKQWVYARRPCLSEGGGASQGMRQAVCSVFEFWPLQVLCGSTCTVGCQPYSYAA